MTNAQIQKIEGGKAARMMFSLFTAAGLLLPAASKASDESASSNSGGAGSSPSTQTVHIPKPKIMCLEMVGSSALLTCMGEQGTNYCIEATACLTPPIQWERLCTNAPASSGLFKYLDTCASNYPMRFYRLVPADYSEQNGGHDNGNGKDNGNAYGNGNGEGNANNAGVGKGHENSQGKGHEIGKGKGHEGDQD